jgi:hypothetical protein
LGISKPSSESDSTIEDVDTLNSEATLNKRLDLELGDIYVYF